MLKLFMERLLRPQTIHMATRSDMLGVRRTEGRNRPDLLKPSRNAPKAGSHPNRGGGSSPAKGYYNDP
jgi:hypothetical protein